MKTIVERLREQDGDCLHLIRAVGGECSEMDNCDICRKILAEKLANEIERCYIPRPRFEDGEPIDWGFEDIKWDDGDNYEFNAITNKGIPCAFGANFICAKAEMTDDGFVKRSTPKVCDADGAEIKEDATLYGTGREQHRYTVQKPYSINEEVGERFCVQCYDHDEGNIVWCDPQMLTYREPDSLNKLLEDMMTDKRTRGTSYIPRIQSLIERGA